MNVISKRNLFFWSTQHLNGCDYNMSEYFVLLCFFLNNRKISEILSSINEVRINLFISNQDILMIGMASTKS